MPRPRPLTPDEARRTLANRFAGTKDKPGLADKLRQLGTKFGIRSKRVFLVWTQFSGNERGEGDEEIVKRLEILPTPKVIDLTSVSLNPFSAGKYPVGSIRVTEISLTLTQDDLAGTKGPWADQQTTVPEDWDFFWLVQEDGRGDNPPAETRYRLAATPNRKEGNVCWEVVLERTAEDLTRSGASRLGVDDDQHEET